MNHVALAFLLKFQKDIAQAEGTICQMHKSNGPG